ncbi:MAG TPA: hypothetical protein VE959_10870 [Bryobacteraceae bacterium]|nr:hypothetical protein [Bryobacteraceae bacterium]
MITKKLANSGIGKKLAWVLGSGLGPAVCLAGLALWGLNDIRTALSEAQLEVDKTLIAQQVAGDMGRVTATVGHIALGSRCEQCHESRTGGDRENQNLLIRQYQDLLKDLQNRESAGEGHRLAGEFERAGLSWHETNRRVLDLTQAGKHAQAVETYRVFRGMHPWTRR